MKIFKSFFDAIYNLFLWASGADMKVLEEAPMDKNKYYGIGGTIVFTALMATFAGGYAFFTAFKDETFAIFFGLFWGALIFNLDRYIVSSFGVGDGKKTISKQELFEAAPRLLMAIVLGIVIATPLELKLFESEINAEIKRLNLKTTQESQNNYMANADSISQPFISEKKELESDMSKRRTDLERLREKRSIAYDKYMCELNGTCGTGKPGEGPVFREAKENYLLLNSEFKSLEEDYAERNRRDFHLIQEKDGAIATIRKEADEKTASLKTEMAGRNGLLARLEALNKLTSKDNAIWTAKWMITLLFVFIEIAPILFKMMTERGPYDDILDRKKHEITVRQMLLKSNINQEINTQVKIHNEKSAQKLEAELFANRELLKNIAQAQAEIASAAIHEWKLKQIEEVTKEPSKVISST